MRRSLPLLVGLVTLAGLIWWWFSGGPAAPPQIEPAAAAKTARAAPVSAPESARRLLAAGLGGIVQTADGAPAAGAIVRLLSDGSPREIAAAADGSFAFRRLPAGDYTLAASLGDLAAEPLGPIFLADGEELEELVLLLARGASLAGTVFDASSGETLAGARLEMAGQVVRSDHAGRFRLGGLSPGRGSLRAQAEGYEPRVQELELPAAAMTGLELRLSRGATVQGQVVDAEGSSVAGATVSARLYQLGGGATGSLAVPAVSTDGEGRFAIATPAGQVELVAVGQDGATGLSAPLDLAPGSTHTGLILRLEPAVELVGTVLAPDGAPAPGARVHVSDLEGRSLASAVSLADGSFSFGRIATGMVRLLAVRGPASGITGPLSLSGGVAEPVVIQLGGGILEGIVEDDVGRPIPGAQVAGWPEGGQRTLASVASTDESGAFRLEGLPEGPLRLEAHAGSGRGERRGVFAGDESVRLVLGSGHLLGLVLLDDRPASDFTVTLSPLEPGGAGARSERFVVPDGRFRLPLPAGNWELRATSPGAGLARAVAVVPGQGDSVEAVLELSSGGVVEGVVLAAEDGSPLAGVRVSIHRGGTFAFGQGTPIGSAYQSVSGPDGRFRLTGVPSGRMPIFAWRSGLQAARPVIVQVEAGETVEAEVRLAAGDGEHEASFGGIGMTLMPMGEGLGVAWVVDGGPAWEAGVRRGDRVLAIDGSQVSNVNEAVERVRGQVGTPVVLSLLRGDVPFRAVAMRTEVRF